MKKYNYKITPIFEAEIKDGKMVISDKEKIRMAKMALSSNDGKYTVEVRKMVNPRSIKQNKALWGLPIKIIYENTFGQFEDDYEVYQWLEEKFSPRKAKTVAGEMVFIRTPLKKLDSNTFGEVYLKIQKFFAGMNIEIPDPDPRWHLKPDKWVQKAREIQTV